MQQKAGGTINTYAISRKTRTAAWFLVILLSLFLITAGAYSVVHAHHDCIGDDCPICENIKALWSLLMDFAKVVFTALVLASVMLVCQHIVRIRFWVMQISSPVHLCVRMND